jgi:ankyrin repeat protein
LHIAASVGDEQLVKTLITVNSLLEMKDECRWTALEHALHGGYVECARIILQARKGPLDQKDIYGNAQYLLPVYIIEQSVLHIALKTGLQSQSICTQLIHLLCDNGADANATDVTKAAPIMTACMWGLLDCVKVLLERVNDPITLPVTQFVGRNSSFCGRLWEYSSSQSSVL